MARGINKVILVGTCGQDPDVRYLPNGNAVTNLSLATSEQWTDKQSDQKVEKTEWHRVSLFGKVAEIAGEYLRRGSQVYIEGKLQTREWEKDGIKRYTTEIIVDMQGTLQLLGGRPQDDNGTRNANSGQGQARPPTQRQAQPQPSEQGKNQEVPRKGRAKAPKAEEPVPGSGDDPQDDDIPFMDPYRFTWMMV